MAAEQTQSIEAFAPGGIEYYTGKLKAAFAPMSHSHGVSDLPVGNASDQVAPGDHTHRYAELEGKPSIEGVVLSGDKKFPDLKVFIDPDADPVQDAPASDDYALTNSEITALWNAAV